MERTYDLEKRLIRFAGMIISIVEKLPKSLAAQHLAGQLVRSGTSPALNLCRSSWCGEQSGFYPQNGHRAQGVAGNAGLPGDYPSTALPE